MSILIKGMKMPKDGCHHMICVYADGTVSTGERVYTAIPVPPHGRLIDADKAVKAIEDLQDCYNGFSDTYDKACIIGVIDEQPTIEAEPVKHGRWRLTRDGQMVYKVCSVCAARTPLNQWRQEWESPFCPSCGAKMYAEEGEEA